MNFQKFRLLGLLSILMPNMTAAQSVAAALEEYVGAPVEQIVQVFGKPSILTQSSVLFHFGGEISDQGLSSNPSPVDDVARGRLGISISPGTRGIAVADLPCTLSFELNSRGEVSAADHHGPGCFEIVYSRTKHP
ncbi:MAG: hypothetical protein AAF387_17425 [Pseudomonadota bacterium]